MAISRAPGIAGRWFSFLLLLLVTPVAAAGPGFIQSSKVSDAASGADIEVRFNCKVQYVRHEPQSGGDRLRIYIEPTSICNGVSPLVAESRSRLRPFDADNAHLIELEYDGSSATGPVLTLSFSGPVSFTVDTSPVAFELTVHVDPPTTTANAVVAAATKTPPTVAHRQVIRALEETPDYAINLASFRRVPTIADAQGLQPAAGQHLFYTQAKVDGVSWYRLRLGTYPSAEIANNALATFRTRFPGAWIDQVDPHGDEVNRIGISSAIAAQPDNPVADAVPAASKVDSLMEQARKAIVAGDTSRAIQIYTKILQLPENVRQPEAQEFLAVAREKNGQTAHARAEYQRYLSLYPDNEGAPRVQQRLAALLAVNRPAKQNTTTGSARRSRLGDWRLQSYFSQYYRRDVNQQTDADEIVSQSALYSDINFDARRRGQRFDFSSRISAGYRNDFLDEGFSSGNSTRISYAYADLADAATGLRGRIGRQSRNRGGVLGRFDGIDLGYRLGERILFNVVAGKPAYSSSDGIDSARSFYGASINYGPVLENLEIGAFYIEQNVEGIQDRQAVGTEFRYFGSNQSIWGMVDYDLSYGELSSAFLQGSWRFGSRLSLHGLADRRGSPFLSTSNAMIGQPVTSFEELAVIFSEDELRQLALDRSSESTTYTVGLSYPVSPKLQLNVDASQSSIEGTPASGGVLATEDSSYRYYSTSVVASSLLKEGDVSIISARYSDSDTTRVISLTVDSRYPFGRTWRVNPGLRVDRRQRMTDSSYEWIYTPGIRVQYRRSQKFRIQIEAGKQYSERDAVNINLDRESWFINLGYQTFF